MKRCKAVDNLLLFAKNINNVPLNYAYPTVELNPLIMRQSIECPIITQPDINSNKFIGLYYYSLKLINIHINYNYKYDT